MQECIVKIEKSVAVLEKDVATLKHDVAEVKTNIFVLKSDMTEVKKELAAVDGKIESSFDSLARAVATGFKEAREDLMAVKDELRKEIRREYVPREEHEFLANRVKKVEHKVGIAAA